MAQWRWAVLAAIGAGLSMGCWAESTIVQEFEEVTALRLKLGSSDAEITRGADNRVEVTVRSTYDEDIYEPVMEQQGTRVILREKFDRGWNVRGHATWSITIPEEFEVDASLGSGDLRIGGVTLELESRQGSGDLTLEEVNGHLRIQHGSGDTELSHVTGEASLRSGSGDIEVDSFAGDLRAGNGSGDLRITQSTGEFDLSNGSGEIRARELAGYFQVRNGSGGVWGSSLRIDAGSQLGSGSGDLRLNQVEITGDSTFSSGSGNTQISLAAPLAGDISVASGSGNARLDFNGQEIAGTIVMRANKRHGRIKAPFDFDVEHEERRENHTTIIKAVTLGEGPDIEVTTGSGTAEIAR